MSDQTSEPQLTEHNYDGIQEYDNPTPGWWNWLFIGSVVFSVFYWLYFQTGVEGRTIIDQYNQASKDLLMKKFYDEATGKIIELQPTREVMIEYGADPKWVNFGKVVFQNNCATCHAPDGRGLTGPNLTDDNWKNVKNLEDIPKVISDGANKGAMPPWKNRLHPNEIVLVACYVASLRGSAPANAKQPEGEPVPPWPTASEVAAPQSGDPAATSPNEEPQPASATNGTAS